MIYYLLPRQHYDLYKDIEFMSKEESQGPFLSTSLSFYLSEIKYRIHSKGKDWDIYKKYTNPFEYINTIPHIKGKCVSKYRPLSRSYYKMLEMIDEFTLLPKNDTITTANNMKCFHIAEGPGGFIEAFVNRRQCREDLYVGMTLLEDKNDTNIPTWSKSMEFLNTNANVLIEKGVDGTGDILKMDNFDDIVKKHGGSCHIVTADGGFDFSGDFNNQENVMSKLLIAQVVYALCCQRKDGHFVLKVFDCFMYLTVDILALLSSFYEVVYICKPQTSRYANSEKYIVCKNFLHENNTDFLPIMRCLLDNTIQCDQYVYRILRCSLTKYFTTKVEEYNSKFGQQQLDIIMSTLYLIETKDHDKIDNLNKNNLQKCVSWCIKHDVPYNFILLNENTNDPMTK